ncbi:protein-glutamate methylesterase/protein-glutamine glutaminase [Agaribacterium haliotis]|uniref:protein-glutamate methylesterase/protein-glutamine glutaminase n=1 Tax=Agaribacterium haliotis TaxID=2013869 RepID=UPI000BB59BDC|nr:chemotaxis response regulator protein-glutamate methylesterase [Agaribacterium haliotis]
MAYKVLVVDDSAFFQTRLKKIIDESPELEVVGVAANGQEAIDLDEKLKPDVISMDYEMPFVDGITAVRTILSRRSVPIVMFSSMTYEGARITLEALDAGAVDFLPKNFAEVSNDSAQLKKRLHEKLISFAKNARPTVARTVSARPVDTNATVSRNSSSKLEGGSLRSEKPSASKRSAVKLKGKVKLVVIGASTGGPVAVTEIVSKLASNFPVPIIVVQHMPENFTRAFSERLDRQCQLSVSEAKNGDVLAAGTVLVAPGGKQLMFEKNASKIKIIDGDDRVNYKPCVDISFGSAAQVFGANVLGIVLTGMGSDGCEGARMLKQKGAAIWSQDQATSVVYGMPAAIANNQLSDEVLAIGEFSGKLTSSL